MVREFDMVGDYDSEPVGSVYDYALEALLDVHNVNDVVEQVLTSVGRDFYQMVVSRLVALATSGFDSSSIFLVQKAGWVPVLVYIILSCTKIHLLIKYFIYFYKVPQLISNFFYMRGPP
jgi:hypothetical protein